jgi:hypothetical protein
MSDLILQLLEKHKGKNGHILYHFEDEKSYLQNALTFIQAGVKEGSQIMLVENDRNQLNILRKLEEILSEEELCNVHFTNNYDFYYSHKTFEPEIIYSHFLENVQSHLDSGVPLWTWGMIEWGDQQEFIQTITEYERQIDSFITQNGLVSVCAYNRNHTPAELENLLAECHDVILTDHEYKYYR